MRSFPQRIFVTGIGTGVGKTLVSAVLTEALQADYWKPVQCGNLRNSDTKAVQKLVANKVSQFHDERYALKTASSPHYAAKTEGVDIKLKDFKLPDTKNRLIIEGAGGLMVPLNSRELVSDLIVKLKTPVVLVMRNYLGSINHTLLSIDALANEGIPLLGIIASGHNFLDNEEIIAQLANVEIIGRVDEAKNINKKFVTAQAAKMRAMLTTHYKF